MSENRKLLKTTNDLVISTHGMPKILRKLVDREIVLCNYEEDLYKDWSDDEVNALIVEMYYDQKCKGDALDERRKVFADITENTLKGVNEEYYKDIQKRYRKYVLNCAKLGMEPFDCEGFMAMSHHLRKEKRKVERIMVNVKWLGLILLVIGIACLFIFRTTLPSEKAIEDKGYQKSYMYVKGLDNVKDAIAYVHQYYPLTYNVYSEEQLEKELKKNNSTVNFSSRFEESTVKVTILIPYGTETVTKVDTWSTDGSKQKIFTTKTSDV